MSDATAKAAAEFQAAEKECLAIRAALRKIGSKPSAIEEENSLKIEWKEASFERFCDVTKLTTSPSPDSRDSSLCFPIPSSPTIVTH